MKEKQCSKCRKFLDIESFHHNKSKSDGLQAYCKECMNIANQKSYYRNYERSLKVKKKWRLNHKQEICDYHKSIRIENRDIGGIPYNIWKKLCYDEKTIQVLFYYSNGYMKCDLCGEDDIDVLNIDHENGDGMEHRKTFKGNINNWLIQNNFPEGFRVLCRNCNWKENLNNHLKYSKTYYNI